MMLFHFFIYEWDEKEKVGVSVVIYLLNAFNFNILEFAVNLLCSLENSYSAFCANKMLSTRII